MKDLPGNHVCKRRLNVTENKNFSYLCKVKDTLHNTVFVCKVKVVREEVLGR